MPNVLLLLSHLNRPFFHICIYRAFDGEHEAISEYLTITITEVNDNPPVFEETNPIVKISEKTPAGSMCPLK